MIKRLRKRFILLSMSAFLAVLVIIIGSINAVSYSDVVAEADMVLDILSENDGGFPRMDEDHAPEDMEDHFPGDREDELPEFRGKESFIPALRRGLSPELPYESRYFSVLLDADTGSVVQSETSRIFAVDTSAAIAYAQTVFKGTRDRGFVDNLRYRRIAEDDQVRIVFLDWGRRLDAFRFFLAASIGLSLAGYIVVFILIAVFSGRIIRPVSESYEKQKRFITDAGHEIKTPLSVIAADADVLELDTGKNEFLDDIRRQTKKLTELTQDLVTLSRMEESGSSLPMIEFPVSDVVREAAEAFRVPAQARGQTLDLQIRPGLSLKGSEKAVAQLVSILLDNALKYSPEGSTVRLSLRQEGRSIVLASWNETAAPVPKESLPLLFDRFYRTDPSRNSETGGHGIGLSIAQAIVNAHNGRIRALSEDGKSLEIRAQFPA